MVATAPSVRAEGLDKFYTRPDVAERLYRVVENMYDNHSDWTHIVEPSAGNGSFFDLLPLEKRSGIDIAPEHPGVTKMDFFDYCPMSNSEDKVLVIGNPPFGKVSSLAIRFFNHASKWATVIAFIVPRTFRRISIQNRLDPRFHLVHDEDVSTTPCAFVPPMSVKCCFQIWEYRRDEPERPRITLSTTHPHWKFLGHGPNDAEGQPTPPFSPPPDFAVRAYGGQCGDIVSDHDAMMVLRPKSWHWISVSHSSEIGNGTEAPSKEILVERFRSLDYSVGTNTARQNSIGRGELVKLYIEKYPNQ